MHNLGRLVLQAAVKGLVSGGIKAAAGAASSKAEEKGSSALHTAEVASALKRAIDNDVKPQLDAAVTKDLNASICFFDEGLLYLSSVFEEASHGKEEQVLTVERDKARKYSISASFAWKEVMNLAKRLDGLDHSAKLALRHAKERLEFARRKATKAFCNEALSTEQRVLAMRYRVAASILANIDHPANALPACKSCLEDLHSTAVIKRCFVNGNKEIRRGVREINSVICDVSQTVCGGGTLLRWPCIDVKGDLIDPLHDLSLEHSCHSSLFGQNEEEQNQLKFAWSIASTSQGQFIIGDGVDRNVKIFDKTGAFLKSLDPFAHEVRSEYQHEVWNVACDQQDNVFILTLKRNQDGEPFLSEVVVFDNCGGFSRKFALTKGFRGSLMTVDDFNRVLVAGGSFTDMCNNVVEVYENDGQFLQCFGKDILYNAQDIAAAFDGNLLVLDTDNDCAALRFFDTEGTHLTRVAVRLPPTDPGCAVAFHRTSQHILIASLHSDNRVQVMIYSNNVKFKRVVQFISKGGPFITGITVTPKGRIGVPCKNTVILA